MKENIVVTEHTKDTGSNSGSNISPSNPAQSSDSAASEQRKVFPGYVLVEMVMSDEAWYVVRNTPGVTSFVGSGTRPVPLQDHEIKSILKQVTKETDKPKAKISFSKGQSVRVIDGPFTEFIGTVSDINMDRNKVTVLVSFFGRETPVVLDFLQVEKI